jgi:hypothetical protein
MRDSPSPLKRELIGSDEITADMVITFDAPFSP